MCFYAKYYITLGFSFYFSTLLYIKIYLGSLFLNHYYYYVLLVQSSVHFFVVVVVFYALLLLVNSTKIFFSNEFFMSLTELFNIMISFSRFRFVHLVSESDFNRFYILLYIQKIIFLKYI